MAIDETTEDATIRTAGDDRCATRAPRLIVPLLVLATLAAYWPVLGHAFISYDDHYFISRNPAMNPPTGASLRAWWTEPQFELYVPLTFTAWGGLSLLARTPPDAAGVALDARVFHAANLLAHVVAVLLAYRLLRLLTRAPWPAAAGALLFALHPVQVQAVAWVSQLKDLLCGALSLAALGWYVSAVDGRARGDVSGTAAKGKPPSGGLDGAGAACASRQDDAPPGNRPSAVRAIPYALGTIALVLATLAKPGAVVVPLMALVVDRVLLRRPYAAIARAVAPWFVLVVPCVLWTRWAQPSRRFAAPVSPWVRPFVAADAVAFYLYKLVWPAWLGVDYKRTPRYAERHNYLYFTWLVPVAAGLAVLRLRQLGRLPAGVLAGALVFVAGLLPVLGFVRFNSQAYSTVADHYLYLPMTGVALCVASALATDWCREARRRWRVVIACGLILTALGVRTWFQTWHWRDDASFLPHAKAFDRTQ